MPRQSSDRNNERSSSRENRSSGYNSKPQGRRYKEDEEDERPSYRRNTRSSSRGRQEKPKVKYVTLMQAFAAENGDRITVNVKRPRPMGNQQEIEDVITLDEWLYFCTQVYYGDNNFRIALFPSDSIEAPWSGTLSMSEEKFNQLMDAYEEDSEEQPKKSAAKHKQAKPAVAQKKTTTKRKYAEEIEETDDDDDTNDIELQEVADVDTDEIPY
jgi:hypothetical protein